MHYDHVLAHHVDLSCPQLPAASHAVPEQNDAYRWRAKQTERAHRACPRNGHGE